MVSNGAALAMEVNEMTLGDAIEKSVGVEHSWPELGSLPDHQMAAVATLLAPRGVPFTATGNGDFAAAIGGRENESRKESQEGH